MSPEDELARSLAVALRDDFAERDATARQLAELLLDATAAALPLTGHDPADAPLAELETLVQQVDLYAWDGAPGWDEVLLRGLCARERIDGGASIVDGLGARDERTQQRGELKRRVRREAERFVALGREAARLRHEVRGAHAQALDQVPTLSPAAVLVAAHGSLLRLVGSASIASLFLQREDESAGALPAPALGELEREIAERGDGFLGAQEEWLARLLAQNPAAAAASFRTFFAGLSQTLRAAAALRTVAAGGPLDVEALLGAVASWQPQRWPSLRAGAPTRWIADLCPAAPEAEPAPARLARECRAALEIFSRLWFARDASPAAFTALAALFVARCASAVALHEELAGGAGPV
jgi:hypothetical protein